MSVMVSGIPHDGSTVAGLADDAFLRAAKAWFEQAGSSTGFEYDVTRQHFVSIFPDLDWTGYAAVSSSDRAHDVSEVSLISLASQMASRASSVATPTPPAPALTGNLIGDIQSICGLTFRQIAGLYGISERAVAEWKHAGIPRHRTEVLEALRSIGLILHGGLGVDGVARWLEVGSPSRLERLSAGDIADVAQQARSYLDTPAT